MSRKCSKCGATLKQTAKFCTVCGTPVAGTQTSPQAQAPSVTLKCPNCGTTLKEGIKFCTKCGSKVQPSDTAPSALGSVLCPHCGFTKNPESSNYCINCGQELSTISPSQPEIKSEVPTPSEPSPGLICPSCGRKTKSGSKFCIFCGGTLPSSAKSSEASEAVESTTASTPTPEPDVTPISVPAKVLASLMARGRQLVLEEEYAKNGAKSDELFAELSQAAGESDFEVEALVDTYINERGELERLEALHEKGEVSERVYERLMKEYEEKLDRMDEQIKDGILQLQGYLAQIQLDLTAAKEELETLSARLLIGDDEATDEGMKEKLSQKVDRFNYAILACNHILQKESAMRNGPITRFAVTETTVVDSKVVSSESIDAESVEDEETEEKVKPKTDSSATPRSSSDSEAGKICPQCGRVTASDAKFCVHCGGSL
ncbi:MAG: zinc-ribbon domain-containing protein [Candidatus Thorarchaeota archaeon]